MDTIYDIVGLPGLIIAGVVVGLVWSVTIFLFFIRKMTQPRVAYRPPIVDTNIMYELGSPANDGPMFTVIGSPALVQKSRKQRRHSRKFRGN